MPEYFINRPTNFLPSNFTTETLEASNAIEYHISLPIYKPTPLIHLPDLAQKYGMGNIYLKNEAFRFGLNAFKGLGASYAIYRLLEKNPNIETFCTATDGNHGRAVAWASKLANRKSVVFVPEDTAESRIKAIENEGATVIQYDGNYDEACFAAEAISAKKGWQLVQDAAWENYEEIPALIMSGYLTPFKELEDSLHTFPEPKIDVVFLQAGVGSWAGAAIWYYLNRYGQKRPKIVVVEPSEANGILASFKADRRVQPQCSFKTIMAGLNCGLPSLTAWEILKNGADLVISVEDEYAEQAIQELYYPSGTDEPIVAGESGVGGLAGFLAIASDEQLGEIKELLGMSPESNILFYSTEGATDPVNFNKIISVKSEH